MLFKFGTEVSGKVELLVMKHIKSGAEAIHLDGTIGWNPKLIIRLGECDGSVRRECFLTGAKTHQELIRPGDGVLRLTTSRKRLERSEEFSSSTKDPAKHFVRANKSTETAYILGRLTRSQSSYMMGRRADRALGPYPTENGGRSWADYGFRR